MEMKRVVPVLRAACYFFSGAACTLSVICFFGGPLGTAGTLGVTSAILLLLPNTLPEDNSNVR